MFDLVAAITTSRKTYEASVSVRAAIVSGGEKDALEAELISRFKEQATAFGFLVTSIDDDARAAVEVSADPTAHASTSPGPVNCQQRLRHQGKAYPRTCERCGLGPCPFFDKHGNSLMRRSAVEGEEAAAQ